MIRRVSLPLGILVLASLLASCAPEDPVSTPTAVPATPAVPTTGPRPSPSPAPTSSPDAVPATAAPTQGTSAVAKAPSTRQPALTLEPPQGSAGQQVQVTGMGFAPGAKIRLRSGLPQEGAQGIDLGGAEADQNGEFRTTFVVPAGTTGQSDGSFLISAVEENRGEVAALAVLFNRQGAAARPVPGAVQGVVITGEVGDVEASAHVINFNDQVHGFTTVAISPAAEIMTADGSPKTLRDIKPGTVIQASGSAIGAGAVLATRIRILPTPS